MKSIYTRSHRFMQLLALATVFTSTLAFAANTAIEPKPKDEKWQKRHEGFVEIANKQTDCQVLFLGDSITDAWRSVGLEVWNKNYAPLNAVNFGISGDRTQHLLWRLQNGEIGKLKPKVIVMMIGTNNTGFESDKVTPRNAPAEIAAGVETLVAYLRKELPQSKILLLAVFPRAEKGALQRNQVNEVNNIIKNLNNGNSVFYLDINQKFLEADGTLPTSIMPDLLHPNLKGYEIWADAIREPLAKLLK